MFFATRKIFITFGYTSFIVLLLCSTMQNCDRNNINNGISSESSKPKGIDITACRNNALYKLRLNSDLLLIEKTESGSLAPSNRHGSNESIQRLIDQTSKMNFDSYFEDGADSILVINYKISSADDPSVIIRTSYVPVYKGALELSSQFFSLSELFPDLAESVEHHPQKNLGK
jgi:hypothetical protein